MFHNGNSIDSIETKGMLNSFVSRKVILEGRDDDEATAIDRKAWEYNEIVI